MLLPVMAPLHHFSPFPKERVKEKEGETAGFRGGREGGRGRTGNGGGEEVPERNKKRRWRRFLA